MKKIICCKGYWISITIIINMASNTEKPRMTANEHRAVATAILEEAEKALQKKIDAQAAGILEEIETLKANSASTGSTVFEHFVHNGSMYDDDVQIDPDLKKGGRAIYKVVETLEKEGYFCRVNEGKFKPIGAYGTYITVSTEEFPDEYDY